MKPCQDVSHAGRRAGLGPGTRSGLWASMAHAIDKLRPRLVVAENVRGLLSARAASDLEPCPWCVGDGDDVPVLRALGAVLGDLADLGYDAAWHGLRAADVGACHGRFRVFVLAWPADADLTGLAWAEPAAGRDVPAGCGGGAVSLLPTPAVNDMGEGKEPEAWDAWTAVMQAKHGNGNGHGKSLAIEAQRLLPTPVVTDAKDGRHATSGRKEDSEHHTGTTLGDVAYADRWGDYARAIARWEAVLGRPAPEPTEPAPKGGRRLSPAFVEWMLGLEPGRVVGVPGVDRRAQLKALGNGVVPQQAAAALRVLLAMAAIPFPDLPAPVSTVAEL